MKKLFVLIIFLLCVMPAYSSNRYDPDDWRYIEDEQIGYIWAPGSGYSDEYKRDNGYYGNNCKEFIRHVCDSEDRKDLPSTDYDNDDRTLKGLTTIEGGQWRNNVHGDERLDRGPTSAEVKIVFSNARSGDVVQMHWGGSTLNTEHTVLINDIDDNGVIFFSVSY